MNYIVFLLYSRILQLPNDCMVWRFQFFIFVASVVDACITLMKHFMATMEVIQIRLDREI